jgi:hypothetical protein
MLARALSLAWLALALTAVGALAAEPQRPDPTKQALTDGCQRNPAALLAFAATGGVDPADLQGVALSPEWAFVNRDPSAKVAEGTLTDPHTAGGDLPEGHLWYDLNGDIKVDPKYEYLVGGDPEKKTGNFQYSGPDKGTLHVEWETGSVPTYVWPTEGDRVKYWGSWIWDCGHWGQPTTDPDFFLPGTGETPFSTEVPGEGTELHPLRAMVVTRKAPYRAGRSETETDVFISSDGTRAYREEVCAVKNPPPTFVSYGPNYTTCVTQASLRQPVNDRDYSFFVPAPPRRSRRAKLRYRVVDMSTGIAPRERIERRSTGIEVTIPFKDFGGDTEPLQYGKSFFVSWSGRDPAPPDHLRVRLKTLKVFDSLDIVNPADPLEPVSRPPGEWNLYFEVNGYWKLLNDWAPDLLRITAIKGVTPPNVFELNRTVDVYVPQGEGVRIFVHGRECDLPEIAPCEKTQEGADDNDGTGDVLRLFRSADAAVGSHALRESNGNYELTYEITRMPAGATPTAPRGRLRLSVSPHRTKAGARRRFAFRVTSRTGRPVSAATVRFGGARVRTDRRGRALLTTRLRRVRRYRAVATRRGFRRGVASVRAVRRPSFTG